MAASLGATLHPTFRAAGDASRTALSGRAMVFAVVGLRGPSPEPARAAGRASGARRRHAPGPLARSCQVENAARTKAGRADFDFLTIAKGAPWRPPLGEP